MAPGPAHDAEAALQEEHVGFIDALDDANRVVLGGAWNPPAGGFEAAYVLRCASLDEARDVAGSDPLVRAGAVRCEVVEWQLVGVNPAAVDRDALLYPD